jgi:hypothetical protein
MSACSHGTVLILYCPLKRLSGIERLDFEKAECRQATKKPTECVQKYHAWDKEKLEKTENKYNQAEQW